ncbi:MAG TPA: hypothetical protein VE422_08910 [Terriglobia bacterium]|nr:hypothetical protein [Terriglobia bacterium]
MKGERPHASQTDTADNRPGGVARPRVADTIGIKDYVKYQNVPHSGQMRIKERFRLVTPDTLWDEITIEDSATLEKPWTFTFAYRRMPDYTLLEYICEDNREYIDEQGKQQIRLTTHPNANTHQR